MEMRCYRKILRISYKDHVTNEEVRAKIQQAIGSPEDLLTIVKICKLQWYGHVSSSSGLAKTILQGTVKWGKKTRQTEEEVGRRHQKMNRPGVRQVPEGSGEQRKMEETGYEIICGAPTTLAVKDDDVYFRCTFIHLTFTRVSCPVAGMVTGGKFCCVCACVCVRVCVCVCVLSLNL